MKSFLSYLPFLIKQKRSDVMRTKSRLNPKLLPLLPFMLVLLALTSWCDESVYKDLVIRLASDFQGDSVQVELDNQILYNGIVTTDESIGYAWLKSVNVFSANHHIEVFVFDREAQSDTTVNVTYSLLVIVNYDRTTNELNFATSPVER